MANSIGGAQVAHPYEVERLRQLAVDLEKEVEKFQDTVQTILKGEDSEPFSFPVPPSRPGERFIKI